MGGVNYLLYAKQRQLAKAGNSKNFANFVNIVRPNYKMTMNTPTLYIIAGCNGAGNSDNAVCIVKNNLAIDENKLKEIKKTCQNKIE